MTNTRTETRAAKVERLRDILKDILLNEPSTIRAAVADEALDYDDDPEVFFNDLQNCGCACGTVGGLIYTADTHAFFDKHYREIEELREDYESNMGYPYRSSFDLKTFYAWFAFEETAYRMAYDDLGLEI